MRNFALPLSSTRFWLNWMIFGGFFSQQVEVSVRSAPRLTVALSETQNLAPLDTDQALIDSSSADLIYLLGICAPPGLDLHVFVYIQAHQPLPS